MIELSTDITEERGDLKTHVTEQLTTILNLWFYRKGVWTFFQNVGENWKVQSSKA